MGGFLLSSLKRQLLDVFNKINIFYLLKLKINLKIIKLPSLSDLDSNLLPGFNFAIKGGSLLNVVFLSFSSLLQTPFLLF